MAVTYTPIATTTLSSANTVTFSSIPTTYTDLMLVMVVRGSRASTSDTLFVRANADSANNYSATYIRGDGGAVSSTRVSNVSAYYVGEIIASTGSSGQFSTVIAQFQNYSNSTTNKTLISRHGYPSAQVEAWVSMWRSTSAITSLEIRGANTANLESGSTFTLFGIKAA